MSGHLSRFMRDSLLKIVVTSRAGILQFITGYSSQ